MRFCEKLLFSVCIDVARHSEKMFFVQYFQCFVPRKTFSWIFCLIEVELFYIVVNEPLHTESGVLRTVE